MTLAYWDKALEEEVAGYTELALKNLEQDGKKLNLHVETTRVAQMDASMLDNELLSLMKSQIQKITKHMPSFAGFLTSHQPEVDLLLRATIWVFCHRLNKPSPGTFPLEVLI